MEAVSSSDGGSAAQATGRLVDVLTSSGVGVWSWDLASGSIRWSVPGSEEVAEMDLVLASSKELVELARSEDRQDLAEAFRRLADDGERLDATFQLDGPGARIIHLEAKRFEGEPPCVMGISRDGTKRAQTERRLSALFDERDRVARALETALLPPTLPGVPGLSVDADYQSSEGAATGDFYDLFPLGRDEWALSIGDVGGHGPAAAAITTSVRYSIRAAALIRRNPSRVLRAANTTHRAAARDERFTTCHFVRMRRNASGLSLRVGTAGHPDLLIRRVGGEIERLSGTGPMLGLTQKPDFVDARATLHVGDVLVAFTDGVTEARRADEFFGEEGLSSFLSEWPGPIEGFAHALHVEANSFNDGVARDDMATVVIQVETMPEENP